MTVPMKNIPAEALQDLDKVKEQFDLWRRGKQRTDRIPEALWAAAAALYPRFSIHQISRALHMDFMGLRERIGLDGQKKQEKRTAARARTDTFIELPRVLQAAPEPVRWTSCRIRMRSSGGGRIDLAFRRIAPVLLSEVLHVLAGRCG